MTAEREAMTLEQVRDGMRAFYKSGEHTPDGSLRTWADAIDAHLSRTAEPVAYASAADLEKLRGLGSGFETIPLWGQRGQGIANTPLFTHPSEDGRDSKVSELVAAARAYFRGYCVDEADDSFECGARYGVDTGCTREQHEAAARLRNALAAMAKERTND